MLVFCREDQHVPGWRMSSAHRPLTPPRLPGRAMSLSSRRPGVRGDLPMNPLFGFLGLESPIHWIILAVIGILLFGKRLPEVGRSLGKGIVEFKKGLKGLEDEVDTGSSAAPAPQAPALEPP